MWLSAEGKVTARVESNTVSLIEHHTALHPTFTLSRRQLAVMYMFCAILRHWIARWQPTLNINGEA